MLAVFSGDGRGEVDPPEVDDVHLPGSRDVAAKKNPKQRRTGSNPNQIDPNNNIMVSLIDGTDFAQPAGAC